MPSNRPWQAEPDGHFPDALRRRAYNRGRTGRPLCAPKGRANQLAPILLGAMYIENDRTNGPQIGGGLTRWHSHLTVCENGKPTIAGFGVQLRGTCNPATWRDRYTSQMLHVWVV